MLAKRRTKATRARINPWGPSLTSDIHTTTTVLLNGLLDPDDEKTWRVFDARYRPVVLAVARRLGLSDEDAADVAQQTMLEFLRDFRSQKYERGRGRLRHWLLGIARHRSLDALRRRRRERGYARADSEFDLEGPDTLEAWWREETQVVVLHAAWERLLRKHQNATETDVFRQVALEGIPVSTVAGIHTIDVNEVYRIKHRLGRKLREITEQLGFAWDEDG